MDDIDRGILYLLQRDARNVTTGEMAESLGIAASTVSTRLKALEERGVVRSYFPFLDYEAAGVPYAACVVCTVPPSRRGGFVEAVLGIENVVGVQSYHTGEGNLHVTVAGPTREAIGDVEAALDDLDVDVERTLLQADQRLQPFDHFAGAAGAGDDTG
jgi:DNA-binding Lrp family transcriptional regulator